MTLPFLSAILARWQSWLTARAERRNRAAAARAIAAEIEKVKAQRADAERLHRPIIQLNRRLYHLTTQRLILELSQ